jgi:murein DD-endopeptidase MepM/ murein hydrolase activator NlpD
MEGSKVLAVSKGKVTKVGYPYNPSDSEKGHLRYVEIKDDNGYKVRYLYVSPSIWVNTLVKEGMVIGEAQGLTEIYKDITDHIHIEVKDPNGDFIDPEEYLKII